MTKKIKILKNKKEKQEWLEKKAAEEERKGTAAMIKYQLLQFWGRMFHVYRMLFPEKIFFSHAMESLDEGMLYSDGLYETKEGVWSMKTPDDSERLLAETYQHILKVYPEYSEETWNKIKSGFADINKNNKDEEKIKISETFVLFKNGSHEMIQSE